jgi:hypothetical protein
MDDSLRKDLQRLDEVHQQIIKLQEEENALAAKLGASSARGVRTAMARILDISLEALRQRYGPIPSVANVIPANEKQSAT